MPRPLFPRLPLHPRHGDMANRLARSRTRIAHRNGTHRTRPRQQPLCTYPHIQKTHIEDTPSAPSSSTAKKKSQSPPCPPRAALPCPYASKNPQPWSPDNPHLYDLRFELCDGDTTIDTVNSYAGLRKFHIEGHKFYLNNTPIFLRLVLDQGFYPDGIWTAPSDDMLKGDIEKSLAVGFNGARLHQKVFEERFHYWADKLGYLTWGEYCDWGMNFGSPQSIHNQQREWREIVQRDLNHPSILAWTPYNETRGGATNHFEAHRRAVQETYDLTRALDPSRPCQDTSGYVHVCTDIYTVHDYEQDPVKFKATYAPVSPDDWKNTPIRFPELNVPLSGTTLRRR